MRNVKQPSLTPFDRLAASGKVYVRSDLSNNDAIETLFHESRHVLKGIPATTVGEAQIRTEQIAFMKSIGLKTMIPDAVTSSGQVNQAAVRSSIGPSYNTVRYRGAVYGDKIVQEARP